MSGRKSSKVLIIRMRKVPIIDATGIKTIKEVYRNPNRRHSIDFIRSHSGQIKEQLKEARLLFAIGKANVTETFQGALERSKVIMGNNDR